MKIKYLNMKKKFLKKVALHPQIYVPNVKNSEFRDSIRIQQKLCSISVGNLSEFNQSSVRILRNNGCDLINKLFKTFEINKQSNIIELQYCF